MKYKDYHKLLIEGKHTTLFRLSKKLMVHANDRDVSQKCENCLKLTQAICQDMKVLQKAFKFIYYITLFSLKKSWHSAIILMPQMQSLFTVNRMTL